jgi:8-oxo-dGTP pyrophosphatase MutT (NUDIX family)
MKIATICFLVTGDSIILANKKRGFGKGYLNGYGGKAEPGEDVMTVALRELKEESGIDANKEQTELTAIIDFFEEDTQLFECHVFFVSNWTDTPVESEEMGQPEIFKRTELPFARMWKSDKEWLPIVCKGEKIHAKAYYKKGMQEMERFEYTPL